MSNLVSLEPDAKLWERVYCVAPIVLVGTLEPDGSTDFAPKHRVVTLSPTLFGFVCRESHATFRNAVREQSFTVSWPTPHQIVMAAAAASPRCEDGEKKALRGLPTVTAKTVEGSLVEGCSFYLECRLDRVIDDYDLDDCLVVGRVEAAHAAADALRSADTGDEALVHDAPLLAYLHPNQFATIDRSSGFPFPKGFTRD